MGVCMLTYNIPVPLFVGNLALNKHILVYVSGVALGFGLLGQYEGWVCLYISMSISTFKHPSLYSHFHHCICTSIRLFIYIIHQYKVILLAYFYVRLLKTLIIWLGTLMYNYCSLTVIKVGHSLRMRVQTYQMMWLPFFPQGVPSLRRYCLSLSLWRFYLKSCMLI